ncbi:uncharacterized protein LOC114290806 [Camellia sinensis]|uniref:uncharacterized protein LOC114290806 n=1 Tax=Camellia sinensis TaxID=4442 RepID=UPI0010365F65|nr:uncharacterized protein LOC114290806 [Camellia sinensis]
MVEEAHWVWFNLGLDSLGEQTHISHCETVKEAWDLLKSIYEEASSNVKSQGNSTSHTSSVDSLNEDSSIDKSENENSISRSSYDGSESSSMEEEIDGVTFREANEMLYKRSITLTKMNIKLSTELRLMEAQVKISIFLNEIESLIAKLSTCEMERNQLLHARDKLKEKYGDLERELETCSKSGKELEDKIISLELELESVKASSAQSVDGVPCTQYMVNDKGGVGVIKGHASASKTSTSKDESTQDFMTRGNITSFSSLSHNCVAKAKFIPICHHYGLKGHIRRHCFELLETKLEARLSLTRPRNRMLETKLSRVPIEGKVNHNIKTPLKNRNSHNIVHTKVVWVRKLDLG